MLKGVNKVDDIVDYYVTPHKDVIPSTNKEFNNNLIMTDYTNNKYYGVLLDELYELEFSGMLQPKL